LDQCHPEAMTAIGIHLIGRDAELDRVTGAIRAMVGGRGGVVVVAGEAGIGKTRLVQEIVERADDAGVATAAGHCSPVSEARLPYAPMVDVLADVVRQCPDLPSSITPEVWHGVAPLMGGDVRPGGVDQALASTRLFAGVVEVLRTFGNRRPALVVLEDVHWADPATADLLAFVARKISTARVLLLVTARREAASGSVTSSLVTELLRLPTTTSVYLKPLTGSEIVELLREVSVLPDSAVGRRVQALAGGIPFFVLHLATRDTEEVVPPHLRDLLSAAMAQLTTDERDILVLLTILGDGADVDLVVRASGIRLQPFNRAVRSLRDRGVLVRRGGSVVFRHALMREVATDETLPGEIQLAHSRVADALLALNPRTPEAAAPLGRHLAAAGRHDEALGYLVSGARRAMDICAFADAAALYETATRCWSLVADAAAVTGVGEAVLLTEMAIACRWCGRLTDARQVLDRASVVSDASVSDASGDQRAMVEHARGQVLWAAGDMSAALQAYRRAATVVDEDGPLHAPIMAALAHGLMATGRAQEAVIAAREAVRLASRTGVDRVRIHAEITEAAARAQLGDVDAAVELLRSCLPRARRIDDIELVYRCYGNLTFALGLACRYAELAEAAKEGAEVCGRYGPVVSLASTVLNNEVTALIQLGRWAEAAQLSIAALQDPAAVGIAALLHVRLAEIAVAMGDDEQAGRNIVAAEGLESDDHYTVSSLCIVKAERALGKGDPVAAVAIITGSLAGLQAQDDAMPLLEACCFGLRAQADAAAQAVPHPRRGQPPATPDLRSIATDAHGRSQLPLANAVLLMCDAEHARARRADTAAEWAAAAAANDGLGRRYARAYSLMRQAAAELRHHARVTAAGLLTLALEIADSLGAQPLAAEIRLLARAGNLPIQSDSEPVVEPSGANDARRDDQFGLTERERQVLDLLTSGATNRTIARRLFISERTASVHVSNILRKFGVSNRTEAAQLALIRRLDTSTPAAGD
jgi:DNA-binding CsgD family transcriptional regulator